MNARLLVPIAVLSLVACSQEAKSPKDSAGAVATPAGKTFTIAMIAKSSANPVFLSGRQGAEDAAAELTKTSGVTVKIDWLTPPNEDAAVQAQRIAEAVNGGANAILLSASDASKVIGANPYMITVAEVTSPTRLCQLGKGRKQIRPTTNARMIEVYVTPRLLIRLTPWGT